ncbi:calcium-binding protein [Hansschlegelia zhihuaiae]|uniref:Calcium-binding protein n=1 Tax=Hansschlegelia zhihuaiae TaxID=405005 RepID=A0A4Q0MN36_9HYPH|nr:calcium-binding protein [Hansschlegelia zhihuaiae]RXF75023.1 calcium-binding protein [Hansschlegelia zhihuaiae]
MLISKEASQVSPLFVIYREGETATVTLSYGLSGYYDEELGYYVWEGDISSTVGDFGDYLYQPFDRPMDLQYTATLADGVTYQGAYDVNDYIDGTWLHLDYRVTAFSTAADFAGKAPADLVFGSELADRVRGAGGDDVLEGAGGADRLAGGLGDDALRGQTGRDDLSGGAGDDLVKGGTSADVLSGGEGADRLVGGRGGDAFVFDSTLGADNVDRIADFGEGPDEIRLSRDVFQALTGETLAAAEFAATADGVATSAEQRLIYAIETGELFYDADGSGAGAAVLFAKLKPQLELTADDFALV